MYLGAAPTADGEGPSAQGIPALMIGSPLLRMAGMGACWSANSLDIRDAFEPVPSLHNYDGEDAERRRTRRRKVWMPATVIS